MILPKPVATTIQNRRSRKMLRHPSNGVRLHDLGK